jgi:hypothetical protein
VTGNFVVRTPDVRDASTIDITNVLVVVRDRGVYAVVIILCEVGGSASRTRLVFADDGFDEVDSSPLVKADID